MRTLPLLIIDTEMELEEASKHVAHLRAFALRLFPDKYGPRFKKLLIEKYRLS